ncbi:MAG: PQQ-dependent sugar dehydrogenase [Chloroflexi bacterium]|nr:PQQ-dependent sugar dehydrogenase [Chloroflexota bacterium]
MIVVALGYLALSVASTGCGPSPTPVATATAERSSASTVLDLNVVNRADITINGIARDDLAGSSVAIGDLNNDGTNDLAIGADSADPEGWSRAGVVFILFGPLPQGSVELATSADVTVIGTAEIRRVGSHVAIGDINNDRTADLVVGTDGGSYVLLGPLSPGTKRLPADAGITLLNVMVAAVGDLSDDGVADLILGQPGASPYGRSHAGNVFVLFGPLSPGVVDPEAVWEATRAILHGGEPEGYAGTSLSIADLNGDGKNDLVIGGPGSSPSGKSSGQVSIIAGPLRKQRYELAHAAWWTAHTTQAFEKFGAALAVGDFNLDGIADLAVSNSPARPFAEAGAQKVYIFLGPLEYNGVLPVIASETASVILRSTQRLSGNLAAIAAGDLNKDGATDLAVGGPLGSPNGRSGAGQVYVLFGKLTSSSPQRRDGGVIIKEKFVDTQGFPIAMAFAPDGRLLFTEREGRIQIADRHGQVHLFYDLKSNGFPVWDGQGWEEGGLLGIALRQDAGAMWVYVMYTHKGASGQDGADPSRHRIIRIRDRDGVGVDAKVVVDDLPVGIAGQAHNGGNIHFGPDGMMYVSIGDNGDNPFDAQNLYNDRGAILRLQPDGTPAPGNPFPQNPRLWAKGLRNPFDFTFQKGTGRLFSADVGESIDELNLIEPGKNYGHPFFQREAGTPGFADPLWVIPIAVTPVGIVFYDGSKLRELTGNLFVCEFNHGNLRRFRVEAGTPPQLVDLGVVAGGCRTDVEEGPDGNLYFADFRAIYRLVRKE